MSAELVSTEPTFWFLEGASAVYPYRVERWGELFESLPKASNVVPVVPVIPQGSPPNTLTSGRGCSPSLMAAHTDSNIYENTTGVREPGWPCCSTSSQSASTQFGLPLGEEFIYIP